MTVNQFEVWIVNFDPSIGAEIYKTRPAVIISNNAANRNLQTVIVAPFTSTERNYPTRTDTFFENKGGQIGLDQMRCVDKHEKRLVKKIGVLPEPEWPDLLKTIDLIFTPTLK